MLGARQQLGLMFRNFCLGYYETTKDSGVFLTSLKIWLYFFRECFFLPSVEDSFRSHLVWAKRRDINLKTIVTARCLTSTVVLSLMVSTDVAVIYSPSKPADKIRKALGDEHIDSLSYWVGITVCVSLFISACALIANFTALNIFNSLSKENAPIILRSSIGLYSVYLPHQLLAVAIHIFFLMTFLSFWEIANPTAVGMTIAFLCAIIFAQVIMSFASMSHLITLNGAMGEDEIISEEKEEKTEPTKLSEHLLKGIRMAKKADVPINYKYRVPYHSILKQVDAGKIGTPLQRDFLDDLRESNKVVSTATSLYAANFPNSGAHDLEER